MSNFKPRLGSAIALGLRFASIGLVSLHLASLAPRPVRAASQRLTLNLSVQPGDSLRDLLDRAEARTASVVRDTFSRDITLSDISLIVLGERDGLVTPLLSLNVRRDRWRTDPRVSTWAQYYPNASSLLGVEAIAPDSPDSTPDTTPTSERPTRPAIARTAQDRPEPGDIHVTLRWDNADDLDLSVTDPNGDRVFFANPSVPSGGELTRDAHAGCPASPRPPVERVDWAIGRAPQGDYVATVTLFSRCVLSSDPVPFELSVIASGDRFSETGTVSDANPTVSFPFAFP